MALAKKLLEVHGGAYGFKGELADQFFPGLEMEPKRGYYLLEKWEERGWWEYGVSVRAGWFTPEGIEHFRSLGLAAGSGA
jgi:hypothetical protein